MKVTVISQPPDTVQQFFNRKPMTTIPTPTESKPCIQYKAGLWYASYRVDGVPKLRSLKTDNFNDAILLRDVFYKELIAKGATRTIRKSPAEKVAENPDRYIIKRDPYVVKVEGVYVGTASTRKKAESMREDYFAQMEVGK